MFGLLQTKCCQHDFIPGSRLCILQRKHVATGCCLAISQVDQGLKCLALFIHVIVPDIVPHWAPMMSDATLMPQVVKIEWKSGVTSLKVLWCGLVNLLCWI